MHHQPLPELSSHPQGLGADQRRKERHGKDNPRGGSLGSVNEWPGGRGPGSCPPGGRGSFYLAILLRQFAVVWGKMANSLIGGAWTCSVEDHG